VTERTKTIKSAACALVTVFLLLTGITAAFAGEGRGSSDPSFCRGLAKVRDFGFSRLPAIDELPESVGEEIGHPHVIAGGGAEEVMTRPGKVGYWFGETSSVNPVLVHWTVVETLWAVDEHGESAREVGHTGLVVGPVNLQHEPSIDLAPPDRLGFYRVNLRIIERGKLVGSYTSFIKLVPPSWRVRMSQDRSVVRAGQSIRWRIENLGTEEADYGADFRLQTRRKGTWKPVPGMVEGPWPAYLAILEPGGTSECFGQRLPRGLAPGKYRILQEVEPPERRRPAVWLTAPFTLLAPR
jgi:hypothetical protein